MRGGIGYQINTVFVNSAIFTPGVSKHSLKALARAKGARSWHEIGKELTICSHDTAETYKTVWHDFAKWAKAELRLKNVEKTTHEHIRAFLEARMAHGVRWSTFQKEAAALQKLELALNMYAAKVGSGIVYDFASSIKEASKRASAKLERGKYTTRAYPNAIILLGALGSDAFKVKAALSYEGGARISETYIKPNQLMGINENGMGVIRLKACNAKGGLERDLVVAKETYQVLANIIREKGIFSANDKSYRAAMQIAATATGQPCNGPHGLRWNFAQRRMREFQGQGFSYEHSLSIVSREMGHSRPDITERYLK